MGVSTATGITAKHIAQKFGFRFCTTDNQRILEDPDVEAVLIATRHSLHAELAISALAAGKHVFVEKPLAISEQELRRVVNAVNESDRHLMVGFNRRFAPLVVEAKRFFGAQSGPLSMVYRVNAGTLPPDHWVRDPREGGRVVGEVCHFVDLLQFLCGSKPTKVYASAGAVSVGTPADDNLVIAISFENGSLGTIAYFSTGDAAIPKEYVEICGAGKTFIIEDFRRARRAIHSNITVLGGRGQDKGQGGEISAFINSVLGSGAEPIPFDQLVCATLATFRILDSLRTGSELPVEWLVGQDGDQSIGED